MSRSRKKISSFSDYSRGANGTKSSKRIASKSVRNFKGDIPNGRAFKKLYCSWNIFDYKSKCWDVDSDWYKQGLRK